MARRRLLQSAALATAGAVVAGVGARGAVDAYRFTVVTERAELVGLRAPLRVAWLCDLHYGPFVRIGSVRAWVDAALAVHADVVVLGGDLVDRRGGEDEGSFLAELARLRAPLGVHAVWGNHDHARFRDLSGFTAALGDLGIGVRLNDAVRLRDDVYLAGIDDWNLGHPDLDAALSSCPVDAACLLASHNPDVLPRVPERVGLTLAGHTHGGQVVLPWIGAPFTSSRYGQRFVGGWVRGPARGYVSHGLGVSTLPIRIGCPAELTVLDLRPSAPFS